MKSEKSTGKILSFLGALLFSFNTFSQNNGDSLINQLLAAKNNHTRVELIFRLADIGEKDISVSNRKSIEERLLKWYREDPDASLHSAIDYLFRPAKKGKASRTMNWNLADELVKIDGQLQKRLANSGWFLTSQLHTMAIIKGPVTYNMGSPANEKGRTDDEIQHKVTIPRSFAISTKEVTVSQFQEFLEVNPSIKQAAARDDSSKFPSIENKKLLFFSPEKDCPQIYVTWYEAAQYCNWLSKRDGIPESEWCYPANERIKSGMEIPEDYLKRKGYRMPTEAEWEYASRAGKSTSRYYGESDELLSEYAWYSKNPPKKKHDPNDPNDPQHTYPVGQLKPNAYGLFDVYGNVWEWCDSRRQPYPNSKAIDEPTSNILITDSIPMIRRGGSFSYDKSVMRSAHRGASQYYPNQRRDNVGFRIAKTLE